MKHLAQSVKFGLKFLLSVGILFYLVSLTRSETLINTFTRFSPSLLVLPLGMTFFIQSLSSYKWLLMARAMGLSGNLGRLYQYYLQGLFIGQFLPTSIGGDFGRAVLMSRDQQCPLAQPMLSIFCERLTGFAALLVLTVIGILKLPNLPRSVLLLLTALTVFTVVLSFGFGKIEAHPWGRWFIRRVLMKSSPHPEGQVIWPNATVVWMGLAISLLYHLLNIWVQMMLFHHFGHPVSFWLVAAIYGISNVITLVPITLNGVGLREGTNVILYPLWGGLPKTVVIAFSLIWLSVILLTAVPGGLLLLTKQWSHIKKKPVEQPDNEESYTFPKRV